jgi:hypothetical protein
MKRRHGNLTPDGEFTWERTKDGLFVCHKGQRIAQRGAPNTPQAMSWISLEPGYEVQIDEQYTSIKLPDGTELRH